MNLISILRQNELMPKAAVEIISELDVVYLTTFEFSVYEYTWFTWQYEVCKLLKDIEVKQTNAKMFMMTQ